MIRADWTAIAGMLAGVVVVAIMFISRATSRRAVGQRELQQLRQDIAQIKEDIGDMKEQLADIVIRLG